jgi:hypothetical protein
LGLWHRVGDSFIGLIGVETEQFKFGYSYDITLSELASPAGGAHEISFGLDFNCPQRRQKVRRINCPSF